MIEDYEDSDNWILSVNPRAYSALRASIDAKDRYMDQQTSKFTAGPWQVNECKNKEHQVIACADYTIIAVCTNVLPHGAMDAKLIAESPVMLDLLKQCANVITNMRSPYTDGLETLMKQVDEVVKRIEG